MKHECLLAAEVLFLLQGICYVKLNLETDPVLYVMFYKCCTM